ncbi:MAG: TIGR01777 family oxidoreductase [Deltaproteobacteria bacterium]|nr:TIGR01777 family oxidoreductase [Deltaproteobacteria bacterium]
MKILVTGATGLVGGALVRFLAGGGHEVVQLGRSAPGAGDIRWDPEAGVLEPDALEGFDGVVHLAGDNIATGRWTAEKKRRIRESRVKGTSLLAATLAGLERPPRVLVSASAIGYYGDRGDEELTEGSAPGSGFLSEVCREWEAATEAAEGKGIRVAHARLGVVLSKDGGALAKMLTPFRLGAGGVIGNGRQYMSWITLDDTVAAIGHLLSTDSAAGPVNVVAPAPVTNGEFTRTLGRVLRRPTLFPMPGFAARLAFGEMADALLLASTRVKPAGLTAAGYAFRHGSLEEGLRYVLGAR